MNTVQTRRLRLRDVRDVFRLLSEIRELANDPKVWRPHMVKRLCKVFGAEIVISSEVHAQAMKKPGQTRIIDIGWGCDASGALRGPGRPGHVGLPHQSTRHAASLSLSSRCVLAAWQTWPKPSPGPCSRA